MIYLYIYTIIAFLVGNLCSFAMSNRYDYKPHESAIVGALWPIAFISLILTIPGELLSKKLTKR